MKRIFVFLYISLICLAVGSCEKIEQEEGNVEYTPIVLTKSQQAVAAKGDAFALDFLRVTSQAFPGTNVFLSPMSASMLCCMLANGAENETYAEIVKAIGMDGFTLDQVNDCYATLVSALLKADRSVSLSLANSMWIANGLELLASYKKQLSTVYDADAYVVDFGQGSTLTRINGWCSEKTKGLIPKMFEELDPQIQLILINALYFKGNWKVQFPKNQTARGDFYASSGSHTSADYMVAASDAFSGYRDDHVSVVRLPYGNGAFYMEVIMPAEKDFNAFLASLTPEKLASWDQNTLQKMEIHLPKFKAEFDTEEQLVAIMQTLGVKKAFSPALAQFGKISNTPLYVSNMRQKAYVSVDEEGTEAAAVTEAELRKNATASVPAMLFNRPFVYLIREKSTGSILFIGTKQN